MRTSTSSASGAARSSCWISKGCERAGTTAAVIFIACGASPGFAPASPSTVMPGLVPGIHVLKCVDRRVKPGHDEGGIRHHPTVRCLGRETGVVSGDGAGEGLGLVEIGGVAGMGDH